MSRKEIGLQLTFEDEQKRKEGELGPIYLVPKGTMIWPEKQKRGITTRACFAEKIEDKRIRGLTGFRLLGPVTLFFDGNYLTLRKNSYFGASPKKQGLRRIKI